METRSQTRAKEDVNDLFNDDLADEDKFDSNLKPKTYARDYNNVMGYDEHDLEAKVKDDLTGESINYQFD